MNNTSFSGTGVSLITPFKKDESIDFDALKRLIDFNSYSIQCCAETKNLDPKLLSFENNQVN